jgi:hypothetical protein
MGCTREKRRRMGHLQSPLPSIAGVAFNLRGHRLSPRGRLQSSRAGLKEPRAQLQSSSSRRARPPPVASARASSRPRARPPRPPTSSHPSAGLQSMARVLQLR